MTVTSTFKMLRPEDVWHPRVGAPLGNRNRLKHGRYTNECKAIRRSIAKWRRETRALMLRAQAELALREIGAAVGAERKCLNCLPLDVKIELPRRGAEAKSTTTLDVDSVMRVAPGVPIRWSPPRPPRESLPSCAASPGGQSRQRRFILFRASAGPSAATSRAAFRSAACRAASCRAPPPTRTSPRPSA